MYETKQEITKNVNDKLAYLLKKRKMSVIRLGKLVGLSQKSVAEITRGEQDWTMFQIYRMTEIFNLPIEFFLRPITEEEKYTPEELRIVLDIYVQKMDVNQLKKLTEIAKILAE